MKTEKKLNEECAVFGVSLNMAEAAGVTYNGLLSLQHRGQEGAGIAVVHDNNITCHKDVGLVSEVFSRSQLEMLPKGNVAVGHTRYSTTGQNKKENTGPFVTEYLTGRIAVAHNGNIINAKEIRQQLKEKGIRFNATSDSEVVSSLLAYCVTTEKSALGGIIQAAGFLRGAFSLVIASSKHKLVAVRDPNGFRPLCIGQNETGFAVASESCALDTCGFAFLRDVLPGEVVVIENGKIKGNIPRDRVPHPPPQTANLWFDGSMRLSAASRGVLDLSFPHSLDHARASAVAISLRSSITQQGIRLEQKEADRGLCIFEYVYFARPDSIIDGLSVYEARYNMGIQLAQEYPVDADVVCGVPDSGLNAASGYSAESGIPLVCGFEKNRYIGRSFIYPTQIQRDSAVRLKLNPLAATVRGKRVVLVDDSIVRGTTSEKIVRSLKNAGAAEIHMRISSPPFRHTCHYGTDIDDEDNLIANKMELDEIRKKIGADSLGFISIDGLKKACGKSNLPFCTACFTGNGKRESIKKDVLEK